MFRISAFILSFATFFASSSPTFSLNNEPPIDDPIIYEFHGDVPPIRLTFSDLDRFLKELRHLYNSMPENTESNCTYELKGPKGRVSGPSIEKVFGDDLFLAYATEFKMNCFNRFLRVVSITISLGRWSPDWTIKGTDRILLESVRSHIDNNLGQAYRNYFAGPLFHILFIFFLMAPWSFLIYKVIVKLLSLKGSLATIKEISPILSFFNFFLILILLIFDIPNYLFPNVAIYKGTASLLERYTPEMALLGLILSMVPLLRTFAIRDQQPDVPSLKP